MKKVLALVVAAAMGLSSVAFAAEAATAAPAKAQVKHHGKKAPVQKAQAAKKHHKKAGAKAPAQKAQAAKKHHKKASHKKA
ncbi:MULTISPECIES: acid resistance repetitive basic protein Asr [Serratia]|uniref:acid resistance repetitive basic protein Asr n=1 Tax=Serratia TaxID=613 RepID=UPI0007455E06|nr:acid resistance repetitive basic protein Asr [Serratia marcescens]CVD53358.1 acid shock protein precursor [Serratia marcescens]CVF10328.1 acid shock protein precursor [Serratia marcescens]